jgi:hypothetical protein
MCVYGKGLHSAFLFPVLNGGNTFFFNFSAKQNELSEYWKEIPFSNVKNINQYNSKLIPLEKFHKEFLLSFPHLFVLQKRCWYDVLLHITRKVQNLWASCKI